MCFTFSWLKPIVMPYTTIYTIRSATASPTYVPTLGMSENRLNNIFGTHTSTITSRNMLVAVYSFSSPALKNRNLAKSASTTTSGNHHNHLKNEE